MAGHWFGARREIGRLPAGTRLPDVRVALSHYRLVESIVASVFVVLAALTISASVWWVVVGLLGHGLKDLWQHRNLFVSTTRWWPPFCAVVDFVAGSLIAVAIIIGIVE